MDARHLSSPAHREHPNFQDQIHLADVLIANKRDLYAETDDRAFERFVAGLSPPKTRLASVIRGHVDVTWLDIVASDDRRAAFPEAHAFLVDTGSPGEGTQGPGQSWLLIEGHGDGYHRCGWLIEPTNPWPTEALQGLLVALDVERIKGLFLTDTGWQAINQDEWSACRAPDDGRARLELIDSRPIDGAGIDRRLRELDGSG
jgi:G3E family GTPase